MSAYGSAAGGQGGAGGAERLRDSAELEALVDAQRSAGRRWAAICASPAVVFESKGWLADKKATAHPAFVDRLADSRRAARMPGASRQQTGLLAHLLSMLQMLLLLPGTACSQHEHVRKLSPEPACQYLRDMHANNLLSPTACMRTVVLPAWLLL